MPSIETPVQTQLEERRGAWGEVVIWITARNRSTGLAESLGFWTGDDHRVFTIGGEDRTYYGAGKFVDVPPVRSAAGLQVIYHSIDLAPLQDEVELALRVYEARQAPVEVHVVPFDIDTGEPLAAPVRMIKGTLQEAPEFQGAKGGRQNKRTLKIASNARRLTQGLPIMKSQEALDRSAPGDKGREHVDVAGEWVVPWGDD